MGHNRNYKELANCGGLLNDYYKWKRFNDVRLGDGKP